MSKQTLYQRATEEMRVLIEALLDLSEKTSNFAEPQDKIWSNNDFSRLLLGGLGYHASKIPAAEKRSAAWLARSAMPFSIELAATGVLYERLQPFIDSMIAEAYEGTRNFENVSSEWVYAHAHLLPVIMHAAGTFSKQDLNKRVGSVSDIGMSRPASQRLASLFSDIGPGSIPSSSQVRERIRATTEGIVRDLVGRLLLEEFVATSLDKALVPYQRESQYKALSGVVYDVRADFVVPNEKDPAAFLEVRKSSARHASLYAKDKMFSAINWKGHHQKCVGVIVVDGPWTVSSLEVMARVFDYVIPIGRVSEVAQALRRYLDGDANVLRWLVEFRIEANGPV